MEGENERLAESALHERLDRADRRTITVVTPNRRLAQALRGRFDGLQAERGATAWESADILPLDAWLERLWDGLLYTGTPAGLPLLMSPHQEDALWDEAVRASPSSAALLAPAATAARAREAWRLAHAWRLLERTRATAAGDDVRAFLDWAARFERLCAQRDLIDRARLPDELRQRLEASCLDGTTLVLHGFDILPPQVRSLVQWLGRCGVSIARSAPDALQGEARRVSFARAADEHWAAARWARARLEANPRARIGIVVPDLARSRDALERVFLRIMDPAAALPNAPAGARAFDLSLGRPLADVALVADALAIVALLHDDVEFEVASRVLRSPFIAGAESEMAARARLDARLRERCGARVGLPALVRLVGAPLFSPTPLLAERLERVARLWRERSRGTQRASAWSSAWAEALRALGFPGERSRDSLEHQALEKWHDTLAAFGTIERVSARLGEREALARLAHMARETVFQAESRAAPVAIVGILESAGLAFDHLWIAGMTDDAWPLPARPNPFIPVGVQREAGVPQADAGASLALDRRITDGWLAAADEVVASHARMRGDEELSVSPLVAHLPEAEWDALGVAPYATLVETTHALRDCERLPDGRAPAIVAAHHPGGTSLFQNQAACPFRAFARNRLASQAPGVPQPGLDAAARGTLLHHVLAHFWDATRTRDAFAALSRDEIVARLEQGAEEAMTRLRRRRPEALEGRFAAIERERLVELAREWLELERQRDGFEVIATEENFDVSFGGVTVKAKVDRIDRLAAGVHAILDYKTGVAEMRSWLGPRPDEPQLPMYALGIDMPVDAVAFARVRPGELDFCGLARQAGWLPNVGTVDKSRSRGARQYKDWDALKEAWRAELAALGREFATGHATVAPKRGNTTCRQCDQQVFCRIAEKRPQLDAGLVGGEGSEGGANE